MDQDIECPRCHRIDPAWDKHRSCTQCHWTLRPDAVEKPYGFDVLIEVRDGSLRTTTAERHYKGNETTTRRRARSFPNFVRVLAVVPLGEAEWLRCYGEGRM